MVFFVFAAVMSVLMAEIRVFDEWISCHSALIGPLICCLFCFVMPIKSSINCMFKPSNHARNKVKLLQNREKRTKLGPNIRLTHNNKVFVLDWVAPKGL